MVLNLDSNDHCDYYCHRNHDPAATSLLTVMLLSSFVILFTMLIKIITSLIIKIIIMRVDSRLNPTYLHYVRTILPAELPRQQLLSSCLILFYHMH